MVNKQASNKQSLLDPELEAILEAKRLRLEAILKPVQWPELILVDWIEHEPEPWPEPVAWQKFTGWTG